MNCFRNFFGVSGQAIESGLAFHGVVLCHESVASAISNVDNELQPRPSTAAKAAFKREKNRRW